MTTNPIPLSVIRDLCETVPGFAERVTVKKVYRGENIAPRQSSARKGIVLPFADILRGASDRDIGDPPAPIPLAPARPMRSFSARRRRSGARRAPRPWAHAVPTAPRRRPPPPARLRS